MDMIIDSATPARRKARAALLRKSCTIVPTERGQRLPHSHFDVMTVFRQSRQIIFPSPALIARFRHAAEIAHEESAHRGRGYNPSKNWVPMGTYGQNCCYR